MLPKEFYTRDPLVVAPELLGKILWCNDVGIVITEVEAYLPNDSACHAFRGKTKRNAPMFEAGGIMYVYLCYGLFNLFNVVTGEAGVPSAILIRAGIPHENIPEIKKRRKGKTDLIGPGKVGQALAADRTMSGNSILTARCHLRQGYAPQTIKTAPRVGIDYAKPNDRDAPLRFIAYNFEPTTEK